jgi:hypothetical protein
MHAPRHVMFTPVERVLAHLLGFLVTVLGRDLLPYLIYLEADVRRNGRNEARREVTLPWFQEEGSRPSQLGGVQDFI